MTLETRDTVTATTFTCPRCGRTIVVDYLRGKEESIMPRLTDLMYALELHLREHYHDKK